MANAITSITTDLTTFGRLLLREVRARLVLARLIPRGNPAGASIIGNTIEIPDLDVSGDASTRAIGGAATASDVISTKRSMTGVQVYKAITVDNLQNLFSSVPLMERAASRIAYKVAKKCDSIVAGLHTEVPYETGEVDGSAAFNATDKYNVLADAYKILMDNEAPTDGLVCVLGTREANALRKLTEAWKVNEAGSSEMLRNAQLGRFFGFDMYESQQIADATLSAAAVTDSPGEIDLVAGYAAGVTTIHVDGLGTGDVKAGTTFSLEDHTGRYVVTEDVTIGTNEADLKIYPALRAATSDGKDVTFTEHSAAGSMNLAFHPEAFASVAWAPAPFQPGSGVASVVVSDDQTGLSIRVSASSTLLGNPGYQESLSADLVFAAKVVRPEFIVKITGD